jgi:DNA polymerase-3 subunit epsilon
MSARARNRRSASSSHFAADHATAKEMSLAQQVRRVECIATGGEVGALLKEAALVKSLQPSHNRVLRRNDDQCFWQLQSKFATRRVAPAAAARQRVGTRSLQRAALRPLQDDARSQSKTLAPNWRSEHRLCHGLLGLEKLKPGQAPASPTRCSSAREPASARSRFPSTARA